MNLDTQDTSDSVALMIREHYALELLELRDENAGLRADVQGLAETLHAAVQGLHMVTRERDQARRSLKLLRASLSTEPIVTPRTYTTKHRRPTLARDMVQ